MEEIQKALDAGSSPRVRGTDVDAELSGGRRRFIPACAGNSWAATSAHPITTVHPRVCGEQGIGSVAHNVRRGSSPRVRGTARYLLMSPPDFRFIPACAGNSCRRHHSRKPSAVHPRVCGEQKKISTANAKKRGSSPRVRGTACLCPQRLKIVRFIPACAGNSMSDRLRASMPTVHPRVCGEQVVCGVPAGLSGGSSPRVRGTDRTARCRHRAQRFIPACAGNRSRLSISQTTSSVHPRVCGEQRWGGSLPHLSHGSSPRVRGTGLFQRADLPAVRFIPACAGNSQESTA